MERFDLWLGNLASGNESKKSRFDVLLGKLACFHEAEESRLGIRLTNSSLEASRKLLRGCVDVVHACAGRWWMPWVERSRSASSESLPVGFIRWPAAVLPGKLTVSPIWTVQRFSEWV